jgi:uncharacterized membrane protein
MRRLATVLLATLVAVSGPALVVGAAGTTAVNLSPASATTDVGATTTFDVVVEAADGGVGNYSFDVALENGSVGSISDVSLAGDPADSNVTFGADNDSVSVSASGTDTADTGSVTVATVTVTADAGGTSAVDLAMSSLTDEAGESYDVGSAGDATLTVGSAAFDVSDLSAPANVTRGDVATVNATVENTGSASGTEDVEFRFDLNGDGMLDADEALANQSVELDAGENTTVSFDVPTDGVAPGTYTHGIFTADSNQTASITVEPAPASLQVTSLDAPANVTTGDAVSVNATLENVGDQSTTDDVEFRFDLDGDGNLTANESLANQSVSLDGGENDTVTFEVSTEGVEPGTYTHGVFTADDNRTASIVVEPQPVDFTVSNLSAPANVTRLETVSVSATVTSEGDRESTQDVQFRFDLDGDGDLAADETLANQSITLQGGENDSVTFEVPTEGVEPGTYAHGVFTASDNETASIDVEPAPATFRLANLTAPDNVTRGDLVTAEVTVENVGDEAGNVTADFRVDLDGDGNLSANETLANQSVELDARENTTVAFEVSSEPLAPGTYTHGVVAGNESTTATIDIEPSPAAFTVGNLTAPENVTQGDSLTVEANVTNVGDLSGTADVAFRFDFDADGELDAEETAANQSVELDGGENATVSFDVPTDELPPGTFTHGVVVDNESAATTIDVTAAREGPNLAVVGLDAPSSVIRGETVTVNTTLRNIGTESVTQDVQFRFDLDGDGNLTENETLSNESVTFVSAETGQVSFAVPTEDVAPGSYTHGVFTENDSANATIVVEPRPANFSVSNLSAPANATRGDSITVNATVTNVGDEAGNDTVDFRVDLDDDGNLTANETVASEMVSLDADENTTVSFDVPTGDLAPGSYTHGVFTANDSATATIDIEPRPADLVVSGLDAPATAPRGETIEVAAEVSNLGDETGNATAAFRVDLDGDGNLTANETLLEESVRVEGRQNETVAFDVPTGDLAPGNYTHGVFLDGANRTAELEVTPRPTGTYLDVWNVTSPTTATQGENVSVTASVANIGNETGEDVVELQLETANGSDVFDQQTLNLTPNEWQTVTFSAAIPENATPGDGTFTVSSANDSVSRAVTVKEAPTEYDRDAIAEEVYGTNFSALDATQAGVVEELYLRQPFADERTLEEVQTRDDIAQERYGMAFDALNRSATVEVQDAFDAQFGDTGENATYDRTEIATAKYGLSFDALSIETAGEVTELFNRQPFAGDLEPADVQTREELAQAEYDVRRITELTREQRLDVEGLYDRQFAA